MLEKPADSAAPLAEPIARRWSGRAFDPERGLSRQQRLALLEAARWAPSCYGAQPWRYLVCEREQQATAWEAALGCLSEGNRSWAKQAPLLLLAVADSRFEHNDEANRWGQYDTGAASVSLCLQATALGLMAHQMGGFDAERARAVFTIPARYTPMAMIAVGHPLPRQRIPETLRERETAPRQRAPLGLRFFAGQWDQPWQADADRGEQA